MINMCWSLKVIYFWFKGDNFKTFVFTAIFTVIAQFVINFLHIVQDPNNNYPAFSVEIITQSLTTRRISFSILPLSVIFIFSSLISRKYLLSALLSVLLVFDKCYDLETSNFIASIAKSCKFSSYFISYILFKGQSRTTHRCFCDGKSFKAIMLIFQICFSLLSFLLGGHVAPLMVSFSVIMHSYLSPLDDFIDISSDTNAARRIYLIIELCIPYASLSTILIFFNEFKYFSLSLSEFVEHFNIKIESIYGGCLDTGNVILYIGIIFLCLLVQTDTEKSHNYSLMVYSLMSLFSKSLLYIHSNNLKTIKCQSYYDIIDLIFVLCIITISQSNFILIYPFLIVLFFASFIAYST